MEYIKISGLMCVYRWPRALEKHLTWLFYIERVHSFAESTYEKQAEVWHRTADLISAHPTGKRLRRSLSRSPGTTSVILTMNVESLDQLIERGDSAEEPKIVQ